MADANFVGNNMVEDDGIPVIYLQFADHMASKFSNQIQQLKIARIYVPAGWHCITLHF